MEFDGTEMFGRGTLKGQAVRITAATAGGAGTAARATAQGLISASGDTIEGTYKLTVPRGRPARSNGTFSVATPVQPTTLPTSPATDDLFDVSRGLSINAHTLLQPVSPIYQDIRDMFGATNSHPQETGHVAFGDERAPGYVDWVELETATAVTLRGVNLFYASDRPDNDWRILDRFRLLAQDLSTGDWVTLLERGGLPDGNDIDLLSATFSPVVAKVFRAEFIRGTASHPGADGPRVVELDGY